MCIYNMSSPIIYLDVTSPPIAKGGNNGKRQRVAAVTGDRGVSASVQIAQLQARLEVMEKSNTKLVVAATANAATAERELFVSNLRLTMNTATSSVNGWKARMDTNIFRVVSQSEYTLTEVHWGALRDAIQPKISNKRAEMVSHFDKQRNE